MTLLRLLWLCAASTYPSVCVHISYGEERVSFHEFFAFVRVCVAVRRVGVYMCIYVYT
jgi:hypothetical protein